MQQIKDISKVNWFEKLIVLLALITMIFILYNISKFQLDKIKQKEIIKLDSLTNYFGTDFTDNGTDENAGTKYVVSFNGAVAANVTLGYPNGIIDIQSA
jgi:hypothetical protein